MTASVEGASEGGKEACPKPTFAVDVRNSFVLLHGFQQLPHLLGVAVPGVMEELLLCLCIHRYIKTQHSRGVNGRGTCVLFVIFEQ